MGIKYECLKDTCKTNFSKIMCPKCLCCKNNFKKINQDNLTGLYIIRVSEVIFSSYNWYYYITYKRKEEEEKEEYEPDECYSLIRRNRFIPSFKSPDEIV